MADCKALIEESRGINARSSNKASGTTSYKGSPVESSVLQIEHLVNRYYDLEYVLTELDILIKCLPSDVSRLVKRRYVDGKTLTQIGRECGKPPSTVGGIIKRAVRQMELGLYDNVKPYQIVGVCPPIDLEDLPY